MIRLDSFLGASGFAFFVWLILVILELNRKQEIKVILKTYVYPFAVIIGVCLCFYIVDRSTYSQGDWKNYNYISNIHIWRDFFVKNSDVFVDNMETYFVLLLFVFLMFITWKTRNDIGGWLILLLLTPFLGEFFYFAFIGRIDGGAFPERCIYILF